MGLWTLWVTGMLSIKSTGQDHRAGQFSTHRFVGRPQKIELFGSDPDLISRWPGELLPRLLRKRLTIYTSPTDRALRVSTVLFRSRKRVGALSAEDIRPAARDYFSKWGNIDVIVYEGKATDRFGHSYFVSNPEVSADLIQLIRYDRAPGETGRPLLPVGAATWKFP